MSTYDIPAPRGPFRLLSISSKGLLSHKLRLAAMALSIVLGVGLLTGTYVLGDSFHATFSRIFGTATQHVSVAIRAQAVGASDSATAPRSAVPHGILDAVSRLPGVERATGSVIGYAQFVGPRGHLVGSFGSPNVGMSVGPTTSLGSMVVVRGRFPRAADEVVTDQATFSNHNFRVGQKVTVAFRGEASTFHLVGVVTLGGSDYLAGATIAGFDLTTAQKVMGIPGGFSEVDLTASPGVSPAALQKEVQAAVGGEYQVITGSELSASTTHDLQAGLAFIPWTLAVFAFVALFLGALIVFNTFSLVAAQRSWELALYRCLGATPRQIMATIAMEASVVGLASCLVGVAWGILAAGTILPRLTALGGIYLPSTVTTIVPRTVLVPIAAGIGATLIAAVVPAIRSGRLSPVAALRGDASLGSGGFTWRRVLSTGTLTAAGVAFLVLGPTTGSTVSRISLVITGSLVVLLGVAVGSPMLVAPLAGSLGAPIERVLGMPGAMARRNSLRNPRRTAGTAAALMIGLALISIVAIMASSVRSSVASGVEGSVSSDFVLVTPNVEPFTPDVIPQLQKLGQVANVAAAYEGTLSLRGGLKHLYGIDPTAWASEVRTTVESGELASLSQGGFATSASVAEENGWHVGQVVSLELSGAGTVPLPLEAIYADNFVDGDFLVSMQTFSSDVLDQGIVFALVTTRPGVDATEARRAMATVLSATPQVQVLDRAQFRQYVDRDVTLLLTLMTALVIQAVAVALFGIVNSLSLSVFERTRELGLLRSIGAARRQLRQMIYWESIIVVGLGAFLGLAVGTACAWAVSRSLAPLGVTDFSIPTGLLALYLVAAVAAGIGASVWPAVRASRIDVLKALAVAG